MGHGQIARRTASGFGVRPPNRTGTPELRRGQGELGARSGSTIFRSVRLAVIVPKSRDLSAVLDLPKRICSQFFRVLPEHVDPSYKFRANGQEIRLVT